MANSDEIECSKPSSDNKTSKQLMADIHKVKPDMKQSNEVNVKEELIDYDYPDTSVNPANALEIKPKLEPDDQFTTIIHHQVECIEDKHPLRSECQNETITDWNTTLNEVIDGPYELVEVGPGEPSLYKCPVCNKTFRLPCYVRRHIDNVHDPGAKVFKCEDCNKSFATKQALERHQPSHATVKHFGCQKCNRRFSLKANLIRHLRNVCNPEEVSNDRPFRCICGSSFKSEDILKRHRVKSCTLEFAASKTSELQCGVCGISLYSRYGVRRHYVLVHPGVTCPYGPLVSRCGDIYEARSTVYALNEFNCGVCGRMFANRPKLTQHVLAQHSVQLPLRSVGDQFPCHICTTMSRKRYNIRRHYALVHPEVECPYGLIVTRDGTLHTLRTRTDGVSKNKFTRISLQGTDILRKQADTVSKLTKERLVPQRRMIAAMAFSCHLCKRSFVGKSRLTEHMIADHSEVRQNGDPTDSSGSLAESVQGDDKVHVTAKKLSDRPIQCTACGSEFTSRSNLEFHEQICARRQSVKLTESRTCPHCDRTFTSEASALTLNRHLRKYICRKCSICLAKFETRVELHAHRRSEHKFLTNFSMEFSEPLKVTKGKKYKCDLCQSSMKSLSNLRHHYARRHPDERTDSAACGLCELTFTDVSSLHNHMMGNHTEFGLKDSVIRKGISNLGTIDDAKTLEKPGSSSNIDVNSLCPFPCSSCGLMFNQKNELRFHLETCTSEKETPRRSCSHCGKQFHNTGSIIKHLRMFICRTCKICKTWFSTCPELYEHRRTQHKFEPKFSVDDIFAKIKDEKRTYPCDKCSRVCRNKRALSAHKAVHGKIKFIRCPKCSKRFKTREALARHQEEHFKIESHFRCPDCKLEFTSSRALIAHSRAHMKEKRLENLLIRNENVIRRDELARSRSTILVKPSVIKHAKIDPSELALADQTQRKLINQDSLQTNAPLQCVPSTDHVTQSPFSEVKTQTNCSPTHENCEQKPEVSYKCFMCTERFATKELYSIHFKKKHDATIMEANISCEVCSRKFKSSRALMGHKRAHLNQEREEFAKRSAQKLKKQSFTILRGPQTVSNGTVMSSAQLVNDIKIEPDDPSVCDICHLVFQNDHDLEAHKMKVGCGMVFSS